jgi:hypothetical protein
MNAPTFDACRVDGERCPLLAAAAVPDLLSARVVDGQLPCTGCARWLTPTARALQSTRLGHVERRILVDAPTHLEDRRVLEPDHAGRAAVEAHGRAIRRLQALTLIECATEKRTVEARDPRLARIFWEDGIAYEWTKKTRTTRVFRVAVRRTAIGDAVVQLRGRHLDSWDGAVRRRVLDWRWLRDAESPDIAAWCADSVETLRRRFIEALQHHHGGLCWQKQTIEMMASMGMVKEEHPDAETLARRRWYNLLRDAERAIIAAALAALGHPVAG